MHIFQGGVGGVLVDCWNALQEILSDLLWCELAAPIWPPPMRHTDAALPFYCRQRFCIDKIYSSSTGRLQGSFLHKYFFFAKKKAEKRICNGLIEISPVWTHPNPCRVWFIRPVSAPLQVTWTPTTTQPPSPLLAQASSANALTSATIRARESTPR